MTPTPDPSSVADFLQSESQPGAVAIDVDAAVKTEIFDAPAPDGVEPGVVRAEIPLDPTYEPNKPTHQSVLYWTMELPDLGTIDVTPAEKTLYLKSLLNDEPAELSIELKNQFQVLLRTRSVFQQKVIFEALQQEQTNNKISDIAAYATRAQLLCGAVSIIEINGRAFPQVTLDAATGIEECGKMLLAHVSTNLETMNWVRWGAVLSALRIFETKIKLCNDNVNNESFWQPAS